MLDPQSWLPQAQALSEGERRRVDHDCGGGRTLIVSHTPNGWTAWCFRCNDSGFLPTPTPSLAERLARLKAVEAEDAAAERDIRPPGPANFDPSSWPLVARVWLYKAGFSNDAIKSLGAYHCEKLQRVILPVLADGHVAYWQARGFDRDRPKYLNPKVDKTRLIARYGSDGPVVLTEDILSAARVGEVAQGWSILGTSLSDWQADAVARQQSHLENPVVIWLDPDAAGRRAARKSRNQLALLGIEATVIQSDRDPKLYSKQEIAEFLSI